MLFGAATYPCTLRLLENVALTPTLNESCGFVVPIPTFPFEPTVILSTLLVRMLRLWLLVVPTYRFPPERATSPDTLRPETVTLLAVNPPVPSLATIAPAVLALVAVVLSLDKMPHDMEPAFRLDKLEPTPIN